MRILSVSASVPFPPDDGTRLRVWNLLRRLRNDAHVTALTWVDDHTPPGAVEALEAVVDRVIVGRTTPTGRGVGRRVVRQLSALAGAQPPWVQESLSERRDREQLHAAVLEAHDRAPFDVVVAEHDAAFTLAPPLAVPMVVHRHNVFEPLLRDLRRRGPAQVGWPLERTVWRRFDRAARGDRVIATTAESADLLAGCLGRTVDVVPNGVDVPPGPVPVAQGKGVAFVGAMEYAPNRDGVRWLIEHVWPQVHRREPAARLRVIGRNGPRVLGDLRDRGVDVLGYVPDLRTALDGCRLGVVPLFAGHGIKNKTLDLLAHGLPVVATPRGAEGLDIEPDGGIEIVGDADRFANAVLELLTDPAAADARGAAGREHVRGRHGWDAAAVRYVEILRAVAGRDAEVLPC